MWKVNHISCRHFLSFKSAEFSIKQDSCTLIYGQNNDNPAQRNNGTGKSSLIEAIAFAITGEPLRAVDKVEELINDNYDDASVEIELENDYDDSLLIVSRNIKRKGNQTLDVHKFDKDDKECVIDKLEQATVLDRNKYVLEEIGVSKDDIYANFILCKLKYKSFFDANDKTKKALINKFSGADLVDQAIEFLDADMKPVEERLTAEKEKCIAIQAKIDVVTSQIEESKSKSDEWEADKQSRIQSITDDLSEKRAKLRELAAQVKEMNALLDNLDEEAANIEDMAERDVSLAEAYESISKIFSQYGIQPTKDYVKQSETIAESIQSMDNEIKDYESKVERLKAVERKCKELREKASASFEEENRNVAIARQKCNDNIRSIDEQLEHIQKSIQAQADAMRECQSSIRGYSKEIEKLKVRLEGVVECPKCGYKFFVGSDDNESDVKSVLEEKSKLLESTEALMGEAEDKLNELTKKQDDATSKKKAESDCIIKLDERVAPFVAELRSADRDLVAASENVSNTLFKLQSLQGRIQTKKDELNDISDRMINDALDRIDSFMDAKESFVKSIEEQQVGIKSSIKMLEESLEAVRNSTQGDFLSSLDSSKAKFEKELQDANVGYNDVKDEYDRFGIQKNNFIEFRSYLANKKVEAISSVTNHFLELIGSDLRVEMLGFKRLKNGSIRDKITVNLLRNGVPCGSYARHSGGERARVNLASILGLQKLTNMSAPKGKGLDILILDEILSESDSDGIDSISSALNALKVTSLLVTQDKMCDSGLDALLIVKEGGYSYIQK